MEERQESEPDLLTDLEEDYGRQQAVAGYETGFKIGKRAGRDEGFTQGLEEGKKRGLEIGFYKGYITTCLILLQGLPSKQKPSKALNKLNELLDLVNTFPNTNETDCEDKLSKIRVKFKRSTSLLNVKYNVSPSQT